VSSKQVMKGGLPQIWGGVTDRPIELEYVEKYRTDMSLLEGALGHISTSSITHCLISHINSVA
jgi:hypothetical protein